MGSEGYLGTSLGRSREVDSRVNSEVNSSQFWTISRKPHQMYRISLHLAVGRAQPQNKTKYGSWERRRVVPRYSPPGHPPGIPTPGTPPPYPYRTVQLSAYVSQTNSGRGAQIRRPTLFKSPFLRVPGYYRGL